MLAGFAVLSLSRAAKVRQAAKLEQDKLALRTFLEEEHKAGRAGRGSRRAEAYSRSPRLLTTIYIAYAWMGACVHLCTYQSVSLPCQGPRGRCSSGAKCEMDLVRARLQLLDQAAAKGADVK